MISSFLAGLQRRRRLLAGVFGALALLSAVGLLRLRIDTDLFSLLPRDLPGLPEFLETSEAFGALDAVYALFDAPDAAAAHAYVDAFARALSASPSVSYVVSRFPREALIARGAPPEAVFALGDEELRTLRRRLEPEGVGEAVARTQRALLSPLGARAAPWLQRDPLGVQLLLLGGLRRLPRPEGLDAEGYWGRPGPSGYRVFVYVRPSRAPGDLQFSDGLVAELRRAEAAARREVGRGGGLRAGFTGAHVVSVEEAAALRSDLASTPGLSLALVLGVCWLYFRKPRPIAALWVCLGLSGLLAVGFLSLFPGTVNVATAAFAAVLFGIADDYGVHLFNGLRHEGAKGLREVYRVEGRSVALGAATLTAAFLVLCTSSFPGLRQFGWVMAASTVAALLVMTLVFPGLAGEPGPSPRERWFRAAERLESLLWRRRTVVFGGAAALVLVLAAAGLPRVRFEPNVRKLAASGETRRVQEEILAFFGNRLEPLVFRWRGRDLREGLGAMAALEGRARDAGEVAHVETPLLFYPRPDRVEAVRAALADLDPEAVGRSVDASLRAAGLRPEAFPGGGRLAAEVVSRARLGGAEASKLSLLPPELQSAWGSRFVRFPATGGGEFDLAAYVYPSARVTSPREARRLAARLGAAGPEWQVAGIGLLTGPLGELLRSDLRRTTALAFALIVAVAVAGLRSPLRAALALVPVTVAAASTLSLLGLLGIPLHVVNFAAIPLVLGLGIDDGLHVVTMAWKQPEKPIARILGESGVAITSTTATTLLAFASLLAARHGGLASFGGLACLGIATAWLATVFVLPPLLRLSRGGRP